MAGHRRGGLILAGLIGLAFTPAAAPLRTAVAARAMRLWGPGPDPVAAFREAPCYAPDPDGATAAARAAEVLR